MSASSTRSRALRDRVRTDLQAEAEENATRQLRGEVLKQLVGADHVRAAHVARRARDRPATRGVRPSADAAERRSPAGRASTGPSSGRRSASRRGPRWPARSCWTRSRGARGSSSPSRRSTRKSSVSPRGRGAPLPRCAHSSRKEGGIGRLVAGLRREKAVDLALSRARIS